MNIFSKIAEQFESRQEKRQSEELDPLARLSWLSRGCAPEVADYIGNGRQALLADAARTIEGQRQLLQDWVDCDLPLPAERCDLLQRSKQAIRGS
jgi:hypothetical protein